MINDGPSINEWFDFGGNLYLYKATISIILPPYY
jgi:hypothetical protein